MFCLGVSAQLPLQELGKDTSQEGYQTLHPEAEN